MPHSLFLPDPFLPDTLHTAAETRAMDAAIIEAGTPGIQLMKRAARAALDTLLAHWPEPAAITVLCGSGNNGGDGYLLAALACERNIPVHIFALATAERLSGDARRAYDYALDAGVSINIWHEGMPLPPTGVVVDALLGTGSDGAPRETYAAAIDTINDSGLPVLALDIPSGLNADTGCSAGSVVQADVTITFIALKRGLFTANAPDVTGIIEYASLDTDPALLPESSDCELLDLDDLQARLLPPRRRTAHKGMFGQVMIIGGDTGMGGAVAMAAEAATRSGAGLTSAATRPEHVPAIIARRPEVMVTGVTSGQGLEPLLVKPSLLVVGPGLGRSAWSEQMLQQSTLCGLPLVLDADALNILAAGRVVREPRRDNWILTPHPAEAARLLGLSTAEVQRDRFAAVRALQQRYGGVIVLKGAGTLVCGPDGNIGLCAGGNPGMASGGMGDVLAGIIGGLLSQGMDAIDAAQLGVCLHAEAADRAAAKNGERGLLASDLFAELRGLVNP
jgi:NAD(P)H-hydrate epimerase